MERINTINHCGKINIIVANSILYSLLMFTCFSCHKKQKEYLEVVVNEVYFSIDFQDRRKPLESKFNSKIISHYEDDTIFLLIRPSSFNQREEFNSIFQLITGNDTLELSGERTYSKLKINPLDSIIDYPIECEVVEHSTKKALEHKNRVFWFKYSDEFLDSVVNFSTLSYQIDTMDYKKRNLKIPKVKIHFASHLRIYYQDYRDYKYERY